MGRPMFGFVTVSPLSPSSLFKGLDLRRGIDRLGWRGDRVTEFWNSCRGLPMPHFHPLNNRLLETAPNGAYREAGA